MLNKLSCKLSSHLPLFLLTSDHYCYSSKFSKIVKFIIVFINLELSLFINDYLRINKRLLPFNFLMQEVFLLIDRAIVNIFPSFVHMNTFFLHFLDLFFFFKLFLQILNWFLVLTFFLWHLLIFSHIIMKRLFIIFIVNFLFLLFFSFIFLLLLLRRFVRLRNTVKLI